MIPLIITIICMFIAAYLGALWKEHRARNAFIFKPSRSQGIIDTVRKDEKYADFSMYVCGTNMIKVFGPGQLKPGMIFFTNETDLRSKLNQKLERSNEYI